MKRALDSVPCVSPQDLVFARAAEAMLTACRRARRARIVTGATSPGPPGGALVREGTQPEGQLTDSMSLSLRLPSSRSTSGLPAPSNTGFTTRHYSSIAPQPGQRLHDAAAAVGDDVVAWLVLQLRNRVRQYSGDRPCVVPLSPWRLLECRGDDELRQPIRPVREASTRVRPVARHHLVRQSALETTSSRNSRSATQRSG